MLLLLLRNVLFIRQPNLKDLSVLFDAQLAGLLLFPSVDIEPLHNWGPRLLWLKSSGGVYFFIRLQNTGLCAVLKLLLINWQNISFFFFFFTVLEHVVRLVPRVPILVGATSCQLRRMFTSIGAEWESFFCKWIQWKTRWGHMFPQNTENVGTCVYFFQIIQKYLWE